MTPAAHVHNSNWMWILALLLASAAWAQDALAPAERLIAEGRYQQEQAIILQVLLAEYGDPGPLLKTGSPSPKASRENGSMQRGAGLSVRLLTHVLMPLNLTQVPTHMSARLAG